MLNRDFFLNSVVIFSLVLLQVFVFNNIQIAGKYSPFVFISYILFTPAQYSFSRVLLFSFSLGLLLDVFLGTLGINALCCIFTVLLRNIFLFRIFSKGDSFLHISDLNIVQILIYTLSLSVFYNLMLYGIESFSFYNLLYSLKEGLFNGLITFAFITIFYFLFKNSFLIK